MILYYRLGFFAWHWLFVSGLSVGDCIAGDRTLLIVFDGSWLELSSSRFCAIGSFLLALLICFIAKRLEIISVIFKPIMDRQIEVITVAKSAGCIRTKKAMTKPIMLIMLARHPGVIIG